MIVINYSFVIFLIILCTDAYVSGEIATRPAREQQILTDAYYNIKEKIENVTIQLYYESLCPGCREFETSQFREVVQKLNGFLNISTYPYGGAETFDHNGKYTFKCQHGPPECYGNKLHACALNLTQNHNKALLYNSCMMDFSQQDQGSDDNAANKCGSAMNIDSKSIIACANSDKGSQLLKYYGDESKKVNYPYVPYILINGKVNDGEHFMRDVCHSFSGPIPPCRQYLNTH